MTSAVLRAIEAVQNLSAKDLDGCSVGDLAQLMYALQRPIGSIFVKTVGRMAGACESRPELEHGGAHAAFRADGGTL